MESSVFWDKNAVLTTVCELTCCFHLQSLRINKETKQDKASSKHSSPYFQLPIRRCISQHIILPCINHYVLSNTEIHKYVKFLNKHEGPSIILFNDDFQFHVLHNVIVLDNYVSGH
jgi:hypothetical protein